MSRGRPDTKTAGFYLSLLDGFELRHESSVIPLPFTGQRLVALLALRNKRLSRRYAARLLWPRPSERRALGNLRMAVWHVRRTELPLLEADAQHVALRQNVVVDVSQMVELADRLVDPAGELRPDELLLSKLDGELLPAWSDDWVIQRREELNQLRVHALEAMCDRLMRSGRHSQAVEAGIAAVNRAYLRETAHRALIRAYLAEGNRADAIRQFQLYERTLRSELDLNPSGELTELLVDP